MKKYSGKKFVLIIIAIEILLLISSIYECFLPLKKEVISYSEMVCVNGKIIDGKGVYTDNSINEGGFFIYGPSTNIERGVYEITINYQTDCLNCYLTVSGDNANYNSILMDDFVLNPLLNSQKFTVWLNKDIRNFAVSVMYDGTEGLLVENITICETISGRIWKVLTTLFICICVNMILFLFYRAYTGRLSKETVTMAFIFTGIILMASYPLFTTFLVEGDDIVFHLLRIEGIKDGLLAGQFPVRIHPTQFRGYGYANSIFYAELFLYIPAVLRLCGMTLQNSYKILLLLFNIATTILSYKCFNGIVKNKKIALVCCAVYVLAPYRLTNMYVRSALGELCAMTFWPVIALGLYRLFTVDVTSKEYKKTWIYLTIGYTGVIQTHLLSCEIVAAVSVIICLILFRYVIRKNTILELIKFFTATVLLNTFFLIPFLDYMIRGGILIVDQGSLQTKAIQGNGIYPAQLFNLFVNGSGMAYGHAVNEYKILGMYEEMGTTIGVALLLALGGFLYLCLVYYKQIKQEKLFVTAFLMSIAGILSLYMSTNLFPWDTLCRNLGSLVYNLQFPWRMLSVGTLFLTVLLGCTLVMMKKTCGEKAYQVFLVIVLATSVITAEFMLYDRLNTSKGIYVYDGVSFANKGSGSLNEYIPSETNVGLLNVYTPLATDNLSLTDYQKSYTNITFSVQETKQKQGNVTVPLLYYAGYEAKDDRGNLLVLTKDDNGIMNVVVPAGFDGTITIRYAGFWYWRVAEIVSVVSFVIFLYFAVKSFHRCADIRND